MKTLIALASVAAITCSYADMNINRILKPPVYYHAHNGNQQASINNVPLRTVIESLYAGYRVSLVGTKDYVVSVKGVPNNAVSILGYLSSHYGLSIEIDNDQHEIVLRASH